jgi:large subunit ribosomal protein L20
MARIKAGQQTRARHKKILDQAKGYSGRRKNTIRTATAAIWRAGVSAYKDRKAKKRNFRGLWIQRINAAAREHGLTYSRLIDGLTKAGVDVDRKMMSDLANVSPESFTALVEKAKAALAA